MPQNPRQPIKDWAPIIAVVITIAAALMVAGQYTGQLKQNTERITALEHANEARDAKLDDIRDRTTRIEAKIEVLLPPEQRGQSR